MELITSFSRYQHQFRNRVVSLLTFRPRAMGASWAPLRRGNTDSDGVCVYHPDGKTGSEIAKQVHALNAATDYILFSIKHQ